LGAPICVVGGMIATELLIRLYISTYGLGNGDIAFTGFYLFPLGVALTYFVLKRYFPTLIVGEPKKEPLTVGGEVFGWVIRIVVIFALLFVGAVVLLVLKPT